jgi:hypothetical protein
LPRRRDSLVSHGAGLMASFEPTTLARQRGPLASALEPPVASSTAASGEAELRAGNHMDAHPSRPATFGVPGACMVHSNFGFVGVRS